MHNVVTLIFDMISIFVYVDALDNLIEPSSDAVPGCPIAKCQIVRNVRP